MASFSKLLAFAKHYNFPFANLCFANFADSFTATKNHSFLFHDSEPSIVGATPSELMISLFKDLMLSKVPAEAINSQFAIQMRNHTTTTLDKDTSRIIRDLLQNFGTFLSDNLIHKRFSHPEIDLFDTKRAVFNLESEEFINACNSGKLLVLNGWDFYCTKSYQAESEFIKGYFTLIPTLQLHVDNIEKTARDNSHVLIGVHIRRGDYANFLGGKYFYDIETYIRLMREVQQQFSSKRVSFFVCSNEKIELNNFSGLNITFSGNNPLLDIYTLARCDYVFGPPSTFSSWAGLLSKQERFSITTSDMQAPPLPANLCK